MFIVIKDKIPANLFHKFLVSILHTIYDEIDIAYNQGRIVDHANRTVHSLAFCINNVHKLFDHSIFLWQNFCIAVYHFLEYVFVNSK
jgi:hypothetical protein